MRILHFADAHIDMANYGRRDPSTGLPLRVLDFLKSLDTIVDTALEQKVDLVVFAGDAYKDRSPTPTFQREWGKRIMRLSQARIPTLLLVGNHDISPSIGRAHALQEFKTLQTPYVRVLDSPELLSPDDLWGLPLQVITVPWVARSALMAALEMSAEKPAEVFADVEARIAELVEDMLARTDDSLPTILIAHASIEGAKVGGERMIMLGADLTLSPSLVKNPKFSYVAMGHIHKPQDVNEGAQPPVIYPGSIERVDFGEKEERSFVVAEIEKGRDTRVTWMPLKDARKFIDCRAAVESDRNVTEFLKSKLPKPKEMKDAIVRLIVEYPRELDSLIDESALRKYAADAFELHFIKRPQSEARARIGEGKSVGSLSPLELLDQYFQAARTPNADELRELAQEIMSAEK